MKIVVDSGSTKADWIIIKTATESELTTTLGLNPEVLSHQDLVARINQSSVIVDIKNSVEELYFYGSGCGTPRSVGYMKTALNEIFPNVKKTVIQEDTYAAVYATTNGNPAIVCINGTGSNCSFFDGEKLIQKVNSLGYMAMDDCSGSDFGRQLIRAYYFKQMPKDLQLIFENQYDLDADTLKNHFYKKENPNAFLAGFLPFLIENQSHEFMQKLISKTVDFFIENYILQFEESRKIPIHFVGSVAFLLQDFFKSALKKYQLTAGNFVQKPIDGLKEYHIWQKK
ncbi:MAG TPA: hypothetical protein VKY32_03710 [Flavobacterium sp.]|nr:hypothetical protein [Flavobacterium sp.]